jgi:hypothetical protein
MLELRQTEENNGLILSISFKLDKEDAADLIKDLQAYIDTPNLYNKSAKEEARLQAQRKLELEKEMKRVFVDVFDDEYLATKFATTYKLDAINREVEILRKKLNKQ